MYDNSKMQGLAGDDHLCLVHEPLKIRIETLWQLMPLKQLYSEHRKPWLAKRDAHRRVLPAQIVVTYFIRPRNPVDYCSVGEP